MGAQDPAGALRVARKANGEYGKPLALALAAQFQPREGALQLLREAAAMVVAQPYGSAETLARIASIAFDFDQQVGHEMFAQAKTRWSGMKTERRNQAE